jgi:hypothetical protein
VFLIHLWSEEDRVPPFNGEIEIEDAETGEVQKLNFDDEARAQYTAGFDAYARGVREVAQRKGGKYAGLPTSTPVEQAVFGSLLGGGR